MNPIVNTKTMSITANIRKFLDEGISVAMEGLSESLRIEKGYEVAKMYYKIGDYDTAIAYLKPYLRLKNTAKAHELIADCYRCLPYPDVTRALMHYKRCVGFSSNESAVILRVCELLLKEKRCNTSCASYWLNLAAKELHDHPLVIALGNWVIHTGVQIQNSEVLNHEMKGLCEDVRSINEQLKMISSRQTRIIGALSNLSGLAPTYFSPEGVQDQEAVAPEYKNPKEAAGSSITDDFDMHPNGRGIIQQKTPPVVAELRWPEESSFLAHDCNWQSNDQATANQEEKVVDEELAAAGVELNLLDDADSSLTYNLDSTSNVDGTANQEVEQEDLRRLGNDGNLCLTDDYDQAIIPQDTLSVDVSQLPTKSRIPVLKMQAFTGEQEEEHQFCFRARLFRYVDNNWMDCDFGLIKILRHSTTGFSRILMLSHETQLLCANHQIVADMTLLPTRDKASFFWAANDLADEVPTLAKFLVKFEDRVTAAAFRLAFTKANKDATVQQAGSNSVFRKPQEQVKLGEEAIPAEGSTCLANLLCGELTPSKDNTQPGRQLQQLTAVTIEKEELRRFGNDDQAIIPQDTLSVDVSQLPTKSRIPVLKMQAFTGQQKEEHQFCFRARLFRYVDNNWMDCDYGLIKILRHSTTGFWRVLMLSHETQLLCANHQIVADMSLLPQSSKASFLWAANDFADEVPRLAKFLVKFEDQVTAEAFRLAFTKANKEAKVQQAGSNSVFLKPPEEQVKLREEAIPAEGSTCLADSLSGKLAPIKDYAQPGRALQQLIAVPVEKKELRRFGNDGNLCQAIILRDTLSVDVSQSPTKSRLPVLKRRAFTGQQEEECKFCFRARLFRYVDNKWMDCDSGLIKILRHSTTGLWRVLMLSHETQLLCANHQIVADMSLLPQSSKASFLWAANDFADEVPKLAKFLVKFEDQITAEAFQLAFTKANKEAKVQQEGSNLVFREPREQLKSGEEAKPPGESTSLAK